MGRITHLRDLIGIFKDKVSQSKAAILISKPQTLSLQLALLRATSHDPFTPPNPKHITTLLSFGQSSRSAVSAVIEALMDRLQSTHDSSVAIKCLITVHYIIKSGSFILLDQLSVYPSTGGKNYLKLSNFRDNATPLTWELSSWVRWYARYVEHLLSTSRVLGFFLSSTSSTTMNDKEEERVSALMNSDLLKEFDSLVGLMEEICKRPDSLHINGNNILVDEIMSLISEDYLSAINDISIRVNEFNPRLSSLSFSDSVELVCVLRRLEDCKERLLVLSTRKSAPHESLWCLVKEIRGDVEMGEAYRERGRLPLTLGWKGRGTESARFEERVVNYGDSVRFSSARFGFNNTYALPVVKSVQSCA